MATNVLGGLEELKEPPVNEELSILLDEMEHLDLNDWEYDFIMDVAENNWLSINQSATVTNIYKKHIDEE